MKKAEKQAELIISIAVTYSTYMDRITQEIDTGENARSWIYRDILMQDIEKLRALGIDIGGLVEVSASDLGQLAA